MLLRGHARERKIFHEMGDEESVLPRCARRASPALHASRDNAGLAHAHARWLVARRRPGARQDIP